jgi:hypothetical protein
MIIITATLAVASFATISSAEKTKAGKTQADEGAKLYGKHCESSFRSVIDLSRSA